ncbi:MAG: TATA-box-binding protein [Candidatus Alkanophagales archaeon]
MSAESRGGIPPIKIENVVANAKLADEFDLKYIESKLEGAKFTKKKFPGLVYRVKEPRAAFLIFRSGKVVCTGSKSIEDVCKVLSKIAEDFRRIGIEVKEEPCEICSKKHPKYNVQNIVASTDLGTELNLSAIVTGLGLEGLEYEPEVFPGLVYRIEDPKVAILIFSSGKLVITGGKTEEDCERAVEILVNELRRLDLI